MNRRVGWTTVLRRRPGQRRSCAVTGLRDDDRGGLPQRCGGGSLILGPGTPPHASNLEPFLSDVGVGFDVGGGAFEHDAAVAHHIEPL
jgi:hypothetical protein